MTCPACGGESIGAAIGNGDGLPSSALCNDCFDFLFVVIEVLWDREGIEDVTRDEEVAGVEVVVHCRANYNAAERLGADVGALRDIIRGAAPAITVLRR